MTALRKKMIREPQTLVDYLGRYTHRAALSNHRLLSCRDGQVRFLYRDRRDGDRRKIATLPAAEFIGRFLKHVLPARFQRIRHYGLLANRGKQQRLDRCRELLGASPRKTTPPPPGLADRLQDVLRIDPTRCPCCGEVLQPEVLAPQPPPRRSSPSPDAWDTS